MDVVVNPVSHTIVNFFPLDKQEQHLEENENDLIILLNYIVTFYSRLERLPKRVIETRRKDDFDPRLQRMIIMVGV